MVAKKKAKTQSKKSSNEEKKEMRCGRNNMFFPIMMIVVGTIFLLETLDIYNGGFSKLWPVILIAFGIIKITEYYKED